MKNLIEKITLTIFVTLIASPALAVTTGGTFQVSAPESLAFIIMGVAGYVAYKFFKK